MSKEYVEDAVLKHQSHEMQAEEYPLRAYQIRQDDRLMVDGVQHKIDHVKIGTKYAHVALANGANKKFLTTDPVVVVRFERTKKAIAALAQLSLRDYVRRQIAEHEKKSQKRVDDLLEKLGDRLKDAWRVTDAYSEFTMLMEAKAAHEPMQLLVDLYRGTHIDTYQGDERASLVAARDWAKDELLRNGRINRGLSRSTSVVRNILEDARAEALADFIQATGWYLEDDAR